MAWRGVGAAVRVGALAAVAVCLGLALAAGSGRSGAAAAKAPKAPTLELAVEPKNPAQGTRAEIVAEVLPASLGRHGTMSARLTSPDGTVSPVTVTRVKGATAGTFEGLAPVPSLGTYRVALRYTGGGRVLTAARSFTVVKGSPLVHDLSVAIVVVVLGGVWLMMRRRR